MIKIGITGQSGFIGSHLYNHFMLFSDEFSVIDFEDQFFESPEKLDKWVKQCDYIVHLAAENRHNDQDYLYNTNIGLVDRLCESIHRTGTHPHVLFSSSSQEARGNNYGDSKREGRQKLAEFSKENNSGFSGLIINNVFGPFGRPDYNSFFATFCYKLVHNEIPEILVDADVKLMYVGNLCNYIIEKIRALKKEGNPTVEDMVEVPYDFQEKVSTILAQLQMYRKEYMQSGSIPELNDINEINVFNTFRSYIDYKSYYPVSLNRHIDNRGFFSEVIRTGTSGQFSYSTTKQGIVRGNHYHTRKVERFTVIQGEALIQLRRIGTKEVFNFKLDGENPSYVDMPVWYTHNIKNIGKEELITLFWINEPYDPDDPDTFFEEV